MRQYLVRHGESVFNVEGRVQGQADAPLSELGRAQAQALVSWTRTLPADVVIEEVWSSPLARARDTAGPIAAALGLPLRVEEGLRELHAGMFEGHLWADLEARFPEEVARWRSGDVAYAIPGGESRADLAARGRTALEVLAQRSVRHMIVVAHGGVLTAALGSLVGRSHPALANAAERPFTKLPALANASLTLLDWPGPALVAFNETGHLEASPRRSPPR
ncbi:MAG: histidine phosphatase family protein [Planctomycetia bacterium]|nr:histidine phosphatase family protein [Planctomycetia bacterium]